MIYVDNANIRYGDKTFFHMTSDKSITELHEFAEKIGLKIEWFQNKGYSHYDITANKREEAIKLGAGVCDSRTSAHYARKLYYDSKNKN